MVSNLRKNCLCIVWHQKPTVIKFLILASFLSYSSGFYVCYQTDLNIGPSNCYLVSNFYCQNISFFNIGHLLHMYVLFELMGKICILNKVFVTNFEYLSWNSRIFYCPKFEKGARSKVIHPKYYKHLKKGALAE